MKFKKGDIVRVNFNPTKGHEQGNFRPALVINNLPLPGNVNIVMPITSKTKQYPFEVELDDRTKTQGVVLPFQVRTIDLYDRNAEVIEQMPQDIIDMCFDYLKRIIEY